MRDGFCSSDSAMVAVFVGAHFSGDTILVTVQSEFACSTLNSGACPVLHVSVSYPLCSIHLGRGSTWGSVLCAPCSIGMPPLLPFAVLILFLRASTSPWECGFSLSPSLSGLAYLLAGLAVTLIRLPIGTPSSRHGTPLAYRPDVVLTQIWLGEETALAAITPHYRGCREGTQNILISRISITSTIL